MIALIIYPHVNMPKNNFDVLKEMAEKNMDIQLAPMDNIIEVNSVGKKAWIKIGVTPELTIRMAKGEKFAGGFIFANKEQFDELSQKE